MSELMHFSKGFFRLEFGEKIVTLIVAFKISRRETPERLERKGKPFCIDSILIVTLLCRVCDREVEFGVELPRIIV